jgi:hypothetical protein
LNGVIAGYAPKAQGIAITGQQKAQKNRGNHSKNQRKQTKTIAGQAITTGGKITS